MHYYTTLNKWQYFVYCLIKICGEFLRITSKDLLGTFNAAVDKHVPGLLKPYRSKKGAFGEVMDDLLDKLDEQVSEVLLCLAFLEEYEYTVGKESIQTLFNLLC